MPSIPREVVEHSLCLVLSSKPAKQRLRHFDNERHRAIGEEVTKLLAAEAMRAVDDSAWLANPILVEEKT